MDEGGVEHGLVRLFFVLVEAFCGRDKHKTTMGC